jgi:hypothetical protein
MARALREPRPAPSRRRWVVAALLFAALGAAVWLGTRLRSRQASVPPTPAEPAAVAWGALVTNTSEGLCVVSPAQPEAMAGLPTGSVGVQAAVPSPTGTQVAVVQENGSLSLVPTEPHGPRGASPGPVDAASLAPGLSWAADGSALVYTVRGDVYLQPSDGKPVRLTTTGDTVTPALSPGGHTVAYARRDRQGGDLGLWAVAVEEQTPRQIVAPTGDIYCATNPHWSPDGLHAAFLQQASDGSAAVGVVGADGAGGQVGLAAAAEPVSWLPDSTAFLFLGSLGPRGHQGLWSCPATGGEAHQLVKTDRATSYALSHDGKLVLMSLGMRLGGKGQASLALYEVQGAVKRATVGLSPADGEAVTLRWSPDGEHVAALLRTPQARELAIIHIRPTGLVLRYGLTAGSLLGWVRYRL